MVSRDVLAKKEVRQTRKNPNLMQRKMSCSGIKEGVRRICGAKETAENRQLDATIIKGATLAVVSEWA